MSKISTESFYYCILAQVYKIDKSINNKSIRCNKLKYALVCLTLNKNGNYIYYDINNLKQVKNLNSNKINIGDWCIISKTKLNLENKQFNIDSINEIIESNNILELLENDINITYDRQYKKTL